MVGAEGVEPSIQKVLNTYIIPLKSNSCDFLAFSSIVRIAYVSTCNLPKRY